MFFEGFELLNVPVPGGHIRLRHGGSGPPLLLLHGNPQSHAMWNLVAPELAKRFHVVCADLRGYGGSLKPGPTPDHAPYAKREMAKDMIAVMRHFGHDRFLLAGHDRGARVSHRLAIDFPDAVEKLAVLDIVPTIEHFERADMKFGLGYYHWFWFAQPHPFPENLINAAPALWFRHHTTRGIPADTLFQPEAMADYLEANAKPETVIGMCEDYRASTTIDLEHDRESRAAGRKIMCPLLALWGSKGKIGQWYDPGAIWRQYCAAEVTTGEVNSGHYLAEESPAEVLDWFHKFFG